MAKLANRSGAVEYTPASGDCEAGTIVVQGGLVGVAPYTIKEGETGFVETKGDYYIPLAAGETFVIGDAVYVDATGKATATVGTNAFFGYAVKATATGSTDVKVALIQKCPDAVVNSGS